MYVNYSCRAIIKVIFDKIMNSVLRMSIKMNMSKIMKYFHLIVIDEFFKNLFL